MTKVMRNIENLSRRIAGILAIVLISTGYGSAANAQTVQVKPLSIVSMALTPSSLTINSEQTRTLAWSWNGNGSYMTRFNWGDGTGLLTGGTTTNSGSGTFSRTFYTCHDKTLNHALEVLNSSGVVGGTITARTNIRAGNMC